MSQPWQAKGFRFAFVFPLSIERSFLALAHARARRENSKKAARLAASHSVASMIERLVALKLKAWSSSKCAKPRIGLRLAVSDRRKPN